MPNVTHIHRKHKMFRNYSNSKGAVLQLFLGELRGKTQNMKVRARPQLSPLPVNSIGIAVIIMTLDILKHLLLTHRLRMLSESTVNNWSSFHLANAHAVSRFFGANWDAANN